MPDGVPSAFTRDRVATLTGLSENQLRRLARGGIHPPRYESVGLYSFMDLVALRVLAQLREHGVSWQKLRRLGEWLRSREVDNPWSSLRFRTDGAEVVVQDPSGKQIWISAQPIGQISQVEEFPFEDIRHQMRLAAADLFARPSDAVGQIESSRGVKGSEAVIKGTRVTVRTITDAHESGMSVSQIVDQFPSLTEQDVEAALKHEEPAA